MAMLTFTQNEVFSYVLKDSLTSMVEGKFDSTFLMVESSTYSFLVIVNLLSKLTNTSLFIYWIMTFNGTLLLTLFPFYFNVPRAIDSVRFGRSVLSGEQEFIVLVERSLTIVDGLSLYVALKSAKIQVRLVL